MSTSAVTEPSLSAAPDTTGRKKGPSELVQGKRKRSRLVKAEGENNVDSSETPPSGKKSTVSGVIQLMKLIQEKKDDNEEDDSAPLQAQVLQQVFHCLDIDQDGQISVEELHNGFAEKLGFTMEETEVVFHSYDLDSSGRITFGELLNKEYWVGPGTPAIKAGRSLMLRAAFNILDMSSKGWIAPKDLRDFLETLGAQGVGLGAITKMVKTFDFDDDGVIKLADFTKMVETTQSVFGLFRMSKLWVLGHMAGVNPKSFTPFTNAQEKAFPGAIQENNFIDCVASAIAPLGFKKSTCIACISFCRDEITNPLAKIISDQFSQAFTFSSLGGILTCGKTGFGAAHAHSPIVNGRERYVYFAMPHIAIDAFGDVGVVRRPGRCKESSACGALVAFRHQIESGALTLETDPFDLEQSILKQKVFARMPYGSKPSLVELTKYTMTTILSDLEKLIELTVDTDKADYVVVTGVQLHGPKYHSARGDLLADGVDYVWPGTMYSVINGKRQPLNLLE